VKEKSTISHKSIREIHNNSLNYSIHKIRTVANDTILGNFKKSLEVVPNIQFLMFGQFIPKNGWESAEGDDNNPKLRNMKTQELEEHRIEELRKLDDSIQREKSMVMLNQFNMIKSVVMNFAFKERGKAILAIEINMNVLEEMRRERKIMMVLRDKDVDEYINMDITEVNLNDKTEWEKKSLAVQLCINDKLDFRAELAQQVSLTRLDYMLKVIRKVHGKGIITNPDAFKDKLRIMRRAEKVRSLQRSKSSTS